MTIQELLGWANSLIVSYGLDTVIKAAFIIFLAAAVIMRFAGRKE